MPLSVLRSCRRLIRDTTWAAPVPNLTAHIHSNTPHVSLLFTLLSTPRKCEVFHPFSPPNTRGLLVHFRFSGFRPVPPHASTPRLVLQPPLPPLWPKSRVYAQGVHEARRLMTLDSVAIHGGGGGVGSRLLELACCRHHKAAALPTPAPTASPGGTEGPHLGVFSDVYPTSVWISTPAKWAPAVYDLYSHTVFSYH